MPATSGVPGHFCFWPTGYKSGGSCALLLFDDSLEWLKELRKMLYLWFRYYYKGHKEPNEETHRTGLKGNRELLCLLPWNQDMSLPWHINVLTNREAPVSFSVQSLHWNFIMDWIIGHAIELNLQFHADFLRRWADKTWLKVPTCLSHGWLSGN